MRDIVITMKNGDVHQFADDVYDEYHTYGNFFQVWFDGAVTAMFNTDCILSIEFIDMRAEVICKD